MMRSLMFFLAVTLSFVVVSCNSISAPTTADDNRLLVRKYHEAWSTGDVRALPELLDTGFVLHFMGNYDYKGVDGAKQAIADTRNAFPDWKESVTEVIAESTRAVSRYQSTGTQQGNYDTIAATGNSVNIPEMSAFRIENGRIMEQWAFWDEILFQQQLHLKK